MHHQCDECFRRDFGYTCNKCCIRNLYLSLIHTQEHSREKLESHPPLTLIAFSDHSITADGKEKGGKLDFDENRDNKTGKAE